MGSIPLIRASQAAPFIEALADAGMRVEPLLEACAIRPDIPEQAPDALVPEYAIWALAESCARAAGTGLFGWQTGLDTPIEQIGAFGRAIGSAGTLRGALRLFLEAVTEHSSHARFSVQPGGGHVWFCRHGIDEIDVGSWQVEQYVLGLMVRLVRLAAGRSWSPRAVRLKQRELHGKVLPPALGGARLQLGSRVTAFGVPVEALDLPLAGAPRAGVALDAIDVDFAGSLRLALEPMLGTEGASLEQAARCAGVTPRTVQRWLEREGSSYSEVLEDVRRAAALRWLAMGDAPIGTIAARLGYADPANFTRAFRRWTGMAPSRYRSAAERTRA